MLSLSDYHLINGHIESFYDLHKSIYQSLWKKNQDIFVNLLNRVDENTQNALIEVEQIVHEARILYPFEKDKDLISHTFMMYFCKIENQTEFEDFKKTFKDITQYKEEYEFYNCGRLAKMTKEILSENNILSVQILSKPDHVFNLFKIQDRIFYYDLWAGEIIEEFKAESFYKHCCLGGCYDLKIYSDESMTKENMLFFQRRVKEINDAPKQNENIKALIESRLTDMFHGMNENDLFLFSKINDIEKLSLHFNVKLPDFISSRLNELKKQYQEFCQMNPQFLQYSDVKASLPKTYDAYK